MINHNKTGEDSGSTIAGRRRLNALSYMGDHLSTQPSSALNNKHQNLYNRASELQF